MGITYDSSPDEGYVIGEGTAVQETDQAILFQAVDDAEGNAQEWYPKSQIHEDSDIHHKDEEGTLVISSWLAEQKGLV